MNWKIQLTINYSEEDNAESDPSSDPKVATYTTNGNSSHKLLTNREIPAIIQGVILPVNQTTAYGVTKIRGALHTIRTVLHKEIFMGTACITTGVLKYPTVVNWRDTNGPIPVDRNTVGILPWTTTQVLTGTENYAYPISIGSQSIEGPMWSIIPQKARNAKPLDASINRFPAEHRDPTPGWSKIIVSKVVTNARGRMSFGSDTVLSGNTTFMKFGLSLVNTTDKLRSVIFPTTRVGRMTNGSDWIQPRNDIE